MMCRGVCRIGVGQPVYQSNRPQMEYSQFCCRKVLNLAARKSQQRGKRAFPVSISFLVKSFLGHRRECTDIQPFMAVSNIRSSVMRDWTMTLFDQPPM